MVPSVVSALGTALARSGRIDEALDLLQHALDRRIYLKAGRYNFYYLLMAIGEARWLAGQIEQALAEVGEAELTARRNGERAHRARSLHLLGAIHACQTPATAERWYLEARDLAEQSSMRPLVADCWLGLADVERRLGRSTAAGTLREAQARLTSLGLTNRPGLAAM
jgi:tetratricopeptide (TPR) repeat protein